MPIETLQDLHDHLELAIQVELSTIPPYLYAMYSIEDLESEPALLLRSIVTEEMLHAVLVTNLLLATGGTPDFASTRYMTRYPSELPHHVPPLLIGLEPCSDEVIRRVFMRIEQPEARGAPAQPDRFESLGQFYHGLEIGLERLAASSDLFADPQAAAQLSNPDFYRPVAMDEEDSGGLTLVDDVESALAAIEIIIHQGEGLSDERWADPSHQELTHYYKLLQISEGSSPLGNVRPVTTNPRTREFPPTIQPVSDLFNAVYRGLYLVLNRMFDPASNQTRAVGVLYLLMADVLAQLARFLVEQPLSDDKLASPTFEIYEFSTSSPLNEVIALAARCAEIHPELATVHEALRGLGFIL
ncbi:MAG: ferritin-like protein [Acidimicrobiia bacterium]|jgi:hypothetical protein